MKNKILIYLIVFLIPICIVSFFFKETSFKIEKEEIMIKVLIREKEEIQTLSLNDYIIGVIAAEMPASFNEEALKAQAVASRTYALKFLKDNKYNYDDSTNDQAFLTIEKMQIKWGNDFNKYYNKIKNIVLKTSDEVITYNDELIAPFYFAISNGYTENVTSVFKENLAYLMSVPSVEEEVRGYKKETIMSKTDFCQKLSLKNCDNITITNVIRNSTERVESIIVNNKNLTGLEVRKKLGLRSTDFKINVNEKEIAIETKGYGHGVGMSQYGANLMAKNGHNYQEILEYYYQGVDITKI